MRQKNSGQTSQRSFLPAPYLPALWPRPLRKSSSNRMPTSPLCIPASPFSTPSSESNHLEFEPFQAVSCLNETNRYLELGNP
jgi:hypothetical protein